jgi:hypothetical protein
MSMSVPINGLAGNFRIKIFCDMVQQPSESFGHFNFWSLSFDKKTSGRIIKNKNSGGGMGSIQIMMCAVSVWSKGGI